MISRAVQAINNLFSTIYLMMRNGCRHDYHFARRTRNLALLSGPGSRNPWTRDLRSHRSDLRGGLNAKNASSKGINQDGS